MEKKYCPYCKSKQEVYPRGTFAVLLVDNSRIEEYQCTKCYRVIRERKGGKKMNRLKLWWKQLFCKHKWSHECWTHGIIKTCVKCGKVKSL